MTNEKLIEKLEIKIFQISTYSSLLKMFLPAIIGCIIFNYILIGYSFYKEEISTYPFIGVNIYTFGALAFLYLANDSTKYISKVATTLEEDIGSLKGNLGIKDEDEATDTPLTTKENIPCNLQ